MADPTRTSGSFSPVSCRCYYSPARRFRRRNSPHSSKLIPRQPFLATAHWSSCLVGPGAIGAGALALPARRVRVAMSVPSLLAFLVCCHNQLPNNMLQIVFLSQDWFSGNRCRVRVAMSVPSLLAFLIPDARSIAYPRGVRGIIISNLLTAWPRRPWEPLPPIYPGQGCMAKSCGGDRYGVPGTSGSCAVHQCVGILWNEHCARIDRACTD